MAPRSSFDSMEDRFEDSLHPKRRRKELPVKALETTSSKARPSELSTDVVSGRRNFQPLTYWLAQTKTQSEFAVNKGKAQEVREWMRAIQPVSRQSNTKKNFLVLRGPTGCGKSLLVQSLATELAVDLVEWTCSPLSRNAVDNLWISARELAYTSVLQSAERSRILLLDNLPDSLPAPLRDEIVNLAKRNSTPAIAIFSCEDRGFDSQLPPSTKIVALREVPSARMNKALAIAASHLGSSIPAHVIEEVAVDSSGDLRGALNALQLVAVADSSTPVPSPEPKLTPARAASKIFYMKELESGKLKDPPESILERLESDSSTTVGYLFENIYNFFTEVDDTYRALEGLSAADVMTRWHEEQETRSLQRECAFYVAARSITVFNEHPAKTKFLPLSSGWSRSRAASDPFEDGYRNQQSVRGTTINKLSHWRDLETYLPRLRLSISQLGDKEDDDIVDEIEDFD